MLFSHDVVCKRDSVIRIIHYTVHSCLFVVWFLVIKRTKPQKDCVRYDNLQYNSDSERRGRHKRIISCESVDLFVVLNKVLC